MINGEKLLSKSYHLGEMKLEEPSKEVLSKLALAGKNNTFKKDKRINIRFSNHDIMGIQRRAAEQVRAHHETGVTPFPANPLTDVDAFCVQSTMTFFRHVSFSRAF